MLQGKLYTIVVGIISKGILAFRKLRQIHLLKFLIIESVRCEKVEWQTNHF